MTTDSNTYTVGSLYTCHFCGARILSSMPHMCTGMPDAVQNEELMYVTAPSDADRVVTALDRIADVLERIEKKLG